MKCAATTIRDFKTLSCESVTPHITHHACRSIDEGGCVEWTSPAELDEGVKADDDGYYTAYATAEHGTRFDPSKVEWSQLAPFVPALELVARALMHGARKHKEPIGSTAWRDVEEPAHVFGNKVARHGLEHVCGRKFDPESKLPHLAHMVANALIVMMTEGDFIK